MIRRTTWILVVIFLVLLGVFWYLQTQENQETPDAEPTTAQKNVIDVPPDQVHRFRIEDANGKVMAMALDEQDFWALAEPQTGTTDQDRAGDAVMQALTLSVLSELATPPVPEAVGLDNPSYKIVLGLETGEDRVIEIGSVTPTGTGYYARLDSGPMQVISKTGVDSVLDVFHTPPLVSTEVPAAAITESLGEMESSPAATATP